MADSHPALLITLLLFLISVSMGGAASSTDPRIIQIVQANGTAWVNPDANAGLNNIVCTDTYSRLKQVCDSFCSTTVKAQFYIQKSYFDYTYGHFDTRNYPLIWQSYNPNVLMQHDLALSKFYAERIAACNLCSGLGTVRPAWVIG